MSGSYAFRPCAAGDLPMLRKWLRTAEVVRWWGNPDEQYAYLEEDVGNALMTMLIVSFEGQPFAYAQHYDVGSWPAPQFESFPEGTRSIDAFVGVPEMLGRGHGAGFLRQLARELRAGGAPAVLIDPDVSNVRARAAYARAGFVGDTILDGPEGPFVLMVFEG